MHRVPFRIAPGESYKEGFGKLERPGARCKGDDNTLNTRFEVNIVHRVGGVRV